MKHDPGIIKQHIDLLFPNELQDDEWIEIAYAEKDGNPKQGVWVKKSDLIYDLEGLTGRNAYVGNSLRKGNTKRKGYKARANESDCGDRFVWRFDVENAENHKVTRQGGVAIPQQEVRGYVGTFLSRISPIYHGNPLYIAYTGGGGDVGIILSRPLDKDTQKSFGEALKLVLRECGALIEEDARTGQITNPIGTDPSKFDVSALERLIGSYTYQRYVQTSFLEINRDSDLLDIDKIFMLEKDLKAEKDKEVIQKNHWSTNHGKWTAFIQELKLKIPFSQFLLHLGWEGQDKGRYWEFKCRHHPPDKHPSFIVWNDIGVAKDYHTEKTYDIISFVQEHMNLDFNTTLKVLADYAGLEFPPKSNRRNIAISERSYGSYGLKDTDIIPLCTFPLNVFPSPLRTVIERISLSLQVEREAVASVMLTIASGAIGNTIRVSPKSGHEVPPFVWLLFIAHSGYGKTPTIKPLIRLVNERQAREYKTYREKLRTYEAATARKAKTEIVITEKPLPEHLLVSDATVEALTNVFESSPRGVIIHQDELAGFILGLNQYKARGRGNDRQHILELFDAQSWKVDRKTLTMFIPNTGAAIVGGIQPQIMPRTFSPDNFDDGLLPRFLLIKLDNKPLKFHREGLDKDDLASWEELLIRSYEIALELNDNGFVKPKILILDSRGLDLWERFHNEFEELKPFLSTRGQVFIPKLLTYALKFMGILHLIKTFSDEKKTIPLTIGEEIVADAIELTRFFAGQAIAILKLYGNSERKLNEFQVRLVNSLFTLKGEVKNGNLLLSRIVEAFNDQLPERFKHTPEKVSSLLRALGLSTKKSTSNLSVLLWEGKRMEELFLKATVTTVTTVDNTFTWDEPERGDDSSQGVSVSDVDDNDHSHIEEYTNGFPGHSEGCDCELCIPEDPW